MDSHNVNHMSKTTYDRTDEIIITKLKAERDALRAENDRLKVRLAACENDLVLFEVSEMLKKTQARVQELEVQLKSKDIIINNQQGRLNYYATKDLLGDKNE